MGCAFGSLRFDHRLEGPNVLWLIAPVGPLLRESAACLDQQAFFRNWDRSFFLQVAVLGNLIGPRSAKLDPAPNSFNLLVCQPIVFLWGHFIVLVLPLDRGHDEAFIRMKGN